MDQNGTGVVTPPVTLAARAALDARPGLIALADSRRGLRDFPPLDFKMNADELARMTGRPAGATLYGVMEQAGALADRTGRPVFVTLAERGIVGASSGKAPEHVPALPVRGAIDVVGAGDAVSANLTAALASGATPFEAMGLAMSAASAVVHQLGTTGTASVEQIGETAMGRSLGPRPSPF